MVKRITVKRSEDPVGGTFITANMVDLIIREDCDVFTEAGEPLIIFRKNRIPQDQLEAFYENTINFVKRYPSSNRGTASGSIERNTKTNPKINTVIIGYFDRWSPRQKLAFTKKGMKIPLPIRETMFNSANPEKFAKTIPLIQTLDNHYREYAPEHYGKQIAKAEKLHPFRIGETCFTTVSINLNFRTAVHVDKNDDPDGLGNLLVIEKGRYTGGEFAIPAFRIAVDCRMGDILFANVHECHGNLPIEFEPNAKRMSLVCYLRQPMYEKMNQLNSEEVETHVRLLAELRGKGRNHSSEIVKTI